MFQFFLANRENLGQIQNNSAFIAGFPFLSLFSLAVYLNLQKPDNIQYNTMVSWFAGTNDLSTKSLMYQALFVLPFLIDFGHSKLIIFIFANL